MRFILQVLLTALLGYLVEFWFSTWAIVVSAAIVSMLVRNHTATSFFGGFVAISLLWMTQSTVIDVYTHAIMSTKIAALLGVKKPIILILITGLVGGLLGGLGGLIGQQLRQIFQKKAADTYKA